MQQTHEIIDKLRTELVSLRDRTIALENFMFKAKVEIKKEKTLQGAGT